MLTLPFATRYSSASFSGEFLCRKIINYNFKEIRLLKTENPLLSSCQIYLRKP